MSTRLAAGEKPFARQEKANTRVLRNLSSFTKSLGMLRLGVPKLTLTVPLLRSEIGRRLLCEREVSFTNSLFVP